MGERTGRFLIYLIQPTHYDDDGYPLQWHRTIVPSNSLACLNGIVHDAIERGVLAGTDVEVHSINEFNTFVSPQKIVAEIAENGGKGFVGLVGVQSNQFPRALDIARELAAGGVPVCIGGFHVSGSIAMLEDLPAELRGAQELPIALFAGQAEDGRIDEVLRDARAGRLKPLYDHGKDMPNLAGAPVPFLARGEIDRTIGTLSSLDLGRGCPFDCSFCAIINVQGRKSRFRTADDLEKIIRRNAADGIYTFFLTDDNFARNRNWEAFCDRLIALRAEGLKVRLTIQIDTLAHKIPRFIEKCTAAGVYSVFIGLENINSDSLESVGKKQNRVDDYREMFLAWKCRHAVITCGYIVGFPNDTKDSVLADIETIKRRLPIDILFLTYLTPLPGSADHRNAVAAGTWLEPDLGKYDLHHRATRHPVMSGAEWDAAYHEGHGRFYDWDHIETIFRRMVATGSNKRFSTLYRLLACRNALQNEGVAMLESAFFRVKRRRQRRSGMPLENPVVFYPRYWAHAARSVFGAAYTYLRLRRILHRAWTDPDRYDYVDEAIAPVVGGTEGEDWVATTRLTDRALRRRGQTAA